MTKMGWKERLLMVKLRNGEPGFGWNILDVDLVTWKAVN